MNKKVVLITGASAGIGKETVKALLEKGYIVYGAARRVDRMSEIEEMGGILIKMDISKEEETVAAIEQIKKENGGVDILINNAGLAIHGPVEEVPIEDARYLYEVNVLGLARLTQLVIPQMREKRVGKIINISSCGGKIHFYLGAWYISTKHALEGWSDCLRMELKAFGIDVVIVEPGIIATEFNDVSLNPLEKKYGKGPYAKMVNSFVNSSRKIDSNPRSSSPPSVISAVIIKAIEAKKPKTRYVAGAGSLQLLYLRKLTSDRLYDRIMEWNFKRS